MSCCLTAPSHYLNQCWLIISGVLQHAHQSPGGGVLPIWWVIHMCRGFDPLFWPSGYQTRSFWGVFSHPPTQKRSFGYKSSQNSIFLAPKYHFSLDLFGSNFQWPAAHPQQFSDRVPPRDQSNLIGCVQVFNPQHELENHSLKFFATSPRGQWVNPCCTESIFRKHQIIFVFATI